MKFKELMDELKDVEERKVDYHGSRLSFELDKENDPHIFFNGRVNENDELTNCVKTIRHSAHEQIANRLNIPHQYYQRMLSNHPDLWKISTNTWAGDNPEKDYFIRTIDDGVRALLSEKYRVIDHLDVVNCVSVELERHREKGIVFDRADLSEKNMFINARFTGLKGTMKPGDDFFGGFIVSNSETGHGSVEVLPRIYRMVCSNGLIVEQHKYRQVHLGYRGSLQEDANAYNAVQEAIRGLFDSFGKIRDTILNSGNFLIPDSSVFLNNVVREFKLSEKQKDNLFIAFGAEEDLTHFGMVNTVTRAAQKEETPEKRYEMEKIGGKVLNFSPSKLEEMAVALT